MNQKTFSQKPADVTRQWVLVDASESTIGRIATVIAQRLTGKHKATYTPHVDGGDYVVVVNAAKVGVTGNKMTDKKYYRHTGYPGGIREKNLGKIMEESPEKVIRSAVKGMLPKNKLLETRLDRLKVFAQEEHNHTAQKPTKIGVK